MMGSIFFILRRTAERLIYICFEAASMDSTLG